MDNNKAEDFKGRAKEAGGDLTGDEDLKREGKADQASAKVKDAVGDAVNKVKDTFKK
ncbi:MAG: CsbD family protein [Acidimicrobiales bacterium]